MVNFIAASHFALPEKEITLFIRSIFFFFFVNSYINDLLV